MVLALVFLCFAILLKLLSGSNKKWFWKHVHTISKHRIKQNSEKFDAVKIF